MFFWFRFFVPRQRQRLQGRLVWEFSFVRRLLMRPIIFTLFRLYVQIIFGAASTHVRFIQTFHWEVSSRFLKVNFPVYFESDRFIIMWKWLLWIFFFNHANVVRGFANVSGWYFAVTANRHHLADSTGKNVKFRRTWISRFLICSHPVASLSRLKFTFCRTFFGYLPVDSVLTFRYCGLFQQFRSLRNLIRLVEFETNFQQK